MTNFLPNTHIRGERVGYGHVGQTVRTLPGAFLHTFCSTTGNVKNDMLMKKQLLGALLCGAALHAPESGGACTRAVYLGPDGMTVTGRTMDWAEPIPTSLYLFPRGIERRGAKSDNTLVWTSKYGSLAVAGYDIGITEGMNEKGLVASLLFLPESVYERPGDDRPVLGLSIWTQYVLDNFATVDETVAELSKERFRIDAPDLPGGKQSRLHLAVTDPSGDTAVFEYIDGKLHVYHDRKYQVLTNSPAYDLQLAIGEYWQQVGGLAMLPGTNRSSDRFARASFYINAVEQSADPAIAIPAVMSVMRNVSVPYGISTPGMPHISSTRWRSVCDQKNRVYYFEPTLSMETLRVNLADADFTKGAPERVLHLDDGTVYSGDATNRFVQSPKPFSFLFGV